MYVRFSAESWEILVRTWDARVEDWEDADVVCSVRMGVARMVEVYRMSMRRWKNDETTTLYDLKRL